MNPLRTSSRRLRLPWFVACVDPKTKRPELRAALLAQAAELQR